MSNCIRFLLTALLFICFPLLAAEQLIIEPDAGRTPLLNAIKNAKSSVNLVMYGLTDSTFIDALIQANDSGKKIQILLEPHPYRAEDENNYAIKRLQASKINLQWPNPDFQLTHQKTFVIDHRSAVIMTFNLTHSSFKNERNFAIITDNPDMVKEIDSVFAADAQHKSIQVSNPNLIWSPDNAEQKILDFIKNAKSSIEVYAQDISDYKTIGALSQAAQQGKQVKILLSNDKNFRLNRKLNYLRRSGVQVHFSANLIIHAKVIIADHTRAILGSINLTHPSLASNRELSMITFDPKVVRQLISTFNNDWNDMPSVSKNHSWLNPSLQDL